VHPNGAQPKVELCSTSSSMLTHHRYSLLPSSVDEGRISSVTYPEYNGLPVFVNIPQLEVQDEYIAEEPGNRIRGGKWKTFEHYKRSTVVPRAGPQYTVDIYDENIGNLNPRLRAIGFTRNVACSCYYDEFGSMGRFDKDLPSLRVVRDAGGFIPPPSDLDGLVARALRSMLPLVKAELSILNSIYELKDFKSLPHTILHIKDFIVNISSTLLTKLKGISRIEADLYLQAQFNIKPLISDIFGIYTAMSRVHSHVNDLLTRAGKLQVQHYRCILNEYPDVHDTVTKDSHGEDLLGVVIPLGDSGLTYDCNSYISKRSVVYSPTTFHAQVQYVYNYDALQTAQAQLWGLLDSFGINMNPAIIWNAIPWSFVVDWFIGVSRWLDSYKVENLKPQINILQYLWSIKRSRTISVETLASNDWLWGDYPRNATCIIRPVVTETAYRRQAGLPTYNSFTMSGLSSTEFSLGAALVITRRRRQRHKLPSR
jgi:hypothetical protein